MELPGQLKNKLNCYIILSVIIFLFSCSGDTEKTVKTVNTKTETHKVVVPDFNSDSAYAFVKKQVNFGPRTPGSKAHAACADYLAAQLKSYGFTVQIQNGTVTTFDKKKFILKNIIAEFNTDAKTRILLSSHWDTRPFADRDTKDQEKPIDGANDGASGVGVALEIARQIALSKPAIGVDIIFFDIEDYGSSGDDESWCLGSQYWAQNLHRDNYNAKLGVLMDMVGAPGAMFPKEQNSVDYAEAAVNTIWEAANKIGYGNYFVPQIRNFVGVDDHIYVNQAGIPCVDIIEYNQTTGGFGAYHHTHKDNMDVIDKNTLKAVGQTLLEVIYTTTP